jgi:protein transport protein SEC24
LQPVDNTLQTMALEFAEYQACHVRRFRFLFSGLRAVMLLLHYVLFSPLFQVCVDVFLTTQSYVDIASISVVPQTTGGRVGILPTIYEVINLVDYL